MKELFDKIKLMFPLELKVREDFKNVQCRFNGTVSEDIRDHARKLGFNEDLIFFTVKPMAWRQNGIATSTKIYWVE